MTRILNAMILIFIELQENAKKRVEGLLLLANESKQSVFNILDSHFAGRPVFLCSNNFHFHDILVLVLDLNPVCD